MKPIPSIFSLAVLTCCILNSQSAPAGPHSQNSNKIEKIRSLVEDFRVRNHIPGLGVAVVQHNPTHVDGGDIELAEGFGYRDVITGLQANERTLFAIGSNSKGFSATMIVNVLRKKFWYLTEAVLDTPIKILAPGFDLLVFSDRFRSEALTFRDIFSMRVCLKNSGYNEMFAASPTKEDFYYRLRYPTEACNFRNGFEYSNGLYGLAGEIAAFIANSTVEQLVLDFMAELGMNDSTFLDMDGKYETLPNISKGYYKRSGVIYEFDNKMLRRVAAVTTAGAILTTPADWVKYINFQLSGGQVDGRQVVPEDILAWLFQNSNPFGAAGNLGRKTAGDPVSGHYGYGFGYMLSVEDGYRMIHHGGYYPPFNSQFSFYPDLNIGILTVSNGPGVTGVETGITHTMIHSSILKILLEEDEIADKNLAADSEFNHLDSFGLGMELKKIHLDSGTKIQDFYAKSVSMELAEEDVTGVFGNAESGDMTIGNSADGSSLLLHYGEWGHGILTSTNIGSIFSVEWTTNLLHQFYTYGELFTPKFYVSFVAVDKLDFVFSNQFGTIVALARFTRNATIDTFPEIPWEENSCGPTASKSVYVKD